jgi:hypothetical protein
MQILQGAVNCSIHALYDIAIGIMQVTAIVSILFNIKTIMP